MRRTHVARGLPIVAVAGGALALWLVLRTPVAPEAPPDDARVVSSASSEGMSKGGLPAAPGNPARNSESAPRPSLSSSWSGLASDGPDEARPGASRDVPGAEVHAANLPAVAPAAERSILRWVYRSSAELGEPPTGRLPSATIDVLSSDGRIFTFPSDDPLRLRLGDRTHPALWSGTLRGPHGRAVRGPGFVVLESTVVAGRKVRFPYDDDGRVSARVPDGAWRVHVVLPARHDTEIVTGEVLAFGDRDLYRDVVVPGGRIEGTVTGDLPGSSSPQRVRCRRLDADASKSRDAIVRSDGSFVIDGLREGTYLLDGDPVPLGDAAGRPLSVTVPRDGVASALLDPAPPRDGEATPVLQVDLR